MRGRVQRHGEVPEERGLDELTASRNLGESVRGSHAETVRARPTSTPSAVDLSPSPARQNALKSHGDANTDGFNIPAASRSKWIAQLGCRTLPSPHGPEPSRLKWVHLPCGGGQRVISCSISRVELVSERLRQHKVTWLVFFFPFISTPKATF